MGRLPEPFCMEPFSKNLRFINISDGPRCTNCYNNPLTNSGVVRPIKAVEAACARMEGTGIGFSNLACMESLNEKMAFQKGIKGQVMKKKEEMKE